jgi:hypothetical protein
VTCSAQHFGLTAVSDKSRASVQAKLTVSSPGDVYEQEADGVSERVMRMPEPPPRSGCACGGGCPTCQAGQPGREHESLQTKRAGPGAAATGAPPPVVQEVLRSPGQPLDAATRAFMEPRFGHDFGGVRVHTDARAAETARTLGARAYTVGSDVVFAGGQYAPSTDGGRLLLAHELTHVLQQRAAPTVRRSPPTEGVAGVTSEERRAGGRMQPPEPVLRGVTHEPVLQRKLLIDEGPQAGGPSLAATVARLVGRALERSDQGVTLSKGKATGGSRIIESFVRRAIDSKQTYRLRLSGTGAAGQAPTPTQPPPQTQPQPQTQTQAQVQLGTAESTNGEIVITINRPLLGADLLTADEIVAEQLVAAVARFDASTQLAPKPSRTGPQDQPYPDVQEDVLLSTPLELKDTHEKQARIEGFVRQRLTHLSPGQQALVNWAGVRATGVLLTEIIRGVETGTPFRLRQEIVGERVNVTYIDPRLLPQNTDSPSLTRFFGNTERLVTFIPGVDQATAPLVNLPLMNSACTVDQQRDENNSCCTQEMLAEFGRHLVEARAAVARTLQRLEGTERIHCDVDKHFGNPSQTELGQIAQRLRVADGELFMSRHGWQCRPKGSGFLLCDRDEWAPTNAVGGAVTFRRRNNIVICTARSAPFTKWTTILHEVMHRVGVRGEEVYRHQSGYPSANPLENADSYAGLVDDLGASDWKPCTPTVFGGRLLGGVTPGSDVVLGARLEFTPSGPAMRVVDLVLGVNFLWSPKSGIIAGEGDDREKILSRGYGGGEIGGRLTLPSRHGTLMFDAAGGLGLRFTDDLAAVATARVGAQWRFGEGPSGLEAGVDLTRLWSLTGEAKDDWVIGISLGYRFGRAGARGREGWP